jgi:hypothetical protein
MIWWPSWWRRTRWTGSKTFTRTAARGAKLIYRSDDHDWDRDPGPVFEYGWNHTTLRALKVDPVDHLSAGPLWLSAAHRSWSRRMRDEFSPEVLQHLEVMREKRQGDVRGPQPGPKFTTEERLDEIIRMHEESGRDDLQPASLHAGRRRAATVDDRQLAFKQEADPKGLLNPGKMIAWDDPDWEIRPDVRLSRNCRPRSEDR